jgi:hypothetical protein
MSSLSPLVLVDSQGQELGRCSIESGVTFERADTVDLGPVGYFRILGVRGADPIVLVAEPAERDELPYELMVREDGIEQRRALVADCSYSVGDRLQWPAVRGQAPVEHEVVSIRPASDDRRSAIVIERLT